MTIPSTTRRLISAYAGVESWKIDHIEAQLCRDIEDDLAWGVRLFDGLLEFEARIHSRAQGLPNEATLTCLGELSGLYAMWLGTSERYLELARKVKDWGYEIEGLDTFERAVAEARWIRESMSIEAEIRPYEELAGQLSPSNPDPVRYGD